jgi:tetratricopeptide (TPR) repeat protein
MDTEQEPKQPEPDAEPAPTAAAANPHARIEAVLRGERAPDSLGALSHEELHFIATRGDDLLRAGQLPAALALFELLVTAQPDEFLFHCRLGAARQASGRLEEAIASYDAALQLNRFDVTSATNRAATLIQLGRIEEAEDNLARIFRMDPDGRHPHTARARELAAALAASKGE